MHNGFSLLQLVLNNDEFSFVKNKQGRSDLKQSCLKLVVVMSAEIKIESAITRLGNSLDLAKLSRSYNLSKFLSLLLGLEGLPIVLNLLRGLDTPFFSPAEMNPHVYHHIHFLVFGFPLGFSIWLIMDWRVRKLEAALSRFTYGELALKGRGRLLCYVPKILLVFAFWFGWDDLKFHYLSRHWSLVHEILVLLQGN
jgi:hypothetical protein